MTSMDPTKQWAGHQCKLVRISDFVIIWNVLANQSDEKVAKELGEPVFRKIRRFLEDHVTQNPWHDKRWFPQPLRDKQHIGMCQSNVREEKEHAFSQAPGFQRGILNGDVLQSRFHLQPRGFEFSEDISLDFETLEVPIDSWPNQSECHGGTRAQFCADEKVGVWFPVILQLHARVPDGGIRAIGAKIGKRVHVVVGNHFRDCALNAGDLSARQT